MAKLIDKLNTLVQSSVRSVLGDDPDRRAQRARPKLGKHLNREIAALRDQINAALDDEDRMATEIDAMQRTITDWDQQADDALKQGDEATARHVIRQMQLQQQRMTMRQAELEQHKLSTSELISQVNALEAIVAEARQQSTTTPSTDEEDDRSLAARLRKARQQALKQTAQKTAQANTRHVELTDETMDEQAIEEDLARRRARLSQ
jgi:phage shock protein A